ncbi:MAG: hypothetical protein MI892_13590, partial [Desulfobacterales bacterium]|nr:hypothetical protein [Desulfobacterales bacterium]
MLTVEQLKPFLLHEHWVVRNHVSSYFNEGQILDPEITSLVLAACEKYGYQENLLPLAQLSGQPVDEDAFMQLLQTFPETDSANVRY